MKALPGYADGGLVGRLSIGSIPAAAPQRAPAIFNFPEIGRYPVTMAPTISTGCKTASLAQPCKAEDENDSFENRRPRDSQPRLDGPRHALRTDRRRNHPANPERSRHQADDLEKLRISIQGSGWSAPGLQGIDTTLQHDVACIIPRAVTADASRQATLPEARRSDTNAEPWAAAILQNGGAVNTGMTLVGNLATADAVPGAVLYQVLYFPS